jgi:hypothetical protein
LHAGIFIDQVWSHDLSVVDLELYFILRRFFHCQSLWRFSDLNNMLAVVGEFGPTIRDVLELRLS